MKKRIIDSGGLILSEYPPLTKSTVYSFSQRNRILAGLTEVTWIVQADHRSGTLITACLARDLGETVATAPASILEKGFQGNIQLLKDGASIITEAQDVLQLLGLSTMIKQTQTELYFSSEAESSVYHNLRFEPINIELLSQQTKISSLDIISHLTMLELQGLVSSVGENQWMRLK